MIAKARLQNLFLHFLARNFTSHLLLYHSCFSEVPADLADDVHNVTPENLYKQLSWYKKHYDIVSLQEWINAKNRRGLVAITFDDAYKSVFNEGLGVLETLNVPATVFIIGGTLEGKVFWRDKIRYLESKGLAAEFIQFLKEKNLLEQEINSNDFYEMSKNPAFVETLSNAELDREMDLFLALKNQLSHLPNHCIETGDDVIDHPLISYGNHTYYHYMLSALSPEDQREDLIRSHQLISKFVKSRYIDIFSVPFGGMNSFDSNTIKICKELNMKALLLSSNSVNGVSGLNEVDGMAIANRYMVPENVDLMIEKIERMTYNRFKKYKFKQVKSSR